jgi:hypothetical protein
MNKLIDIKCNCGRRGRYLMNGDMGELSCNKYAMCPTYETLEQNAGELMKDMLALQEAFRDQMNFKEGSEYSVKSVAVYEAIQQKYGR